MTNQQTKEIIIQELKKNYGIISDACKAAGISRSTFYNLKKENIEFINIVDLADYESHKSCVLTQKMVGQPFLQQIPGTPPKITC